MIKIILNKLLTSTGILILGIVIFLLGCIQPSRYERAKESGYEIEATVVKVVEKIEDSFEGPSSTTYTIYVDYSVDGNEYKNIKVAKYYDTDKYSVGDTIIIVVNPNNPEKMMFEGGIVCVIGFIIVVFAIILKIKTRKNK